MPNLTVSFRGASHALDLPLTAPLSDLAAQLERLTGVPPANQKLVCNGKKTTAAPEASLEDAGLRAGAKIMLLGSTSGEIDKMKSTESEAQRRDAIMAKRAASGPSKIQSTGSSSSASHQYRFHRIESLKHLPKPEEATMILTKLANDPAIKHIMQTHKFAVGLLTELAPHEHPNLLGLNENAGQAIKLRIRTDAYDGFRLYSEIRRVSLHELTHNVWGDHDNNFKALNSQLNREVAQFEAAAKEGSNTLGGGGYVYEGSAGGDHHEQAGRVLGGSGLVGGTNVLGGPSHGETREERRARIVEAAMRRFQEEEAEIEDRCAT